jgi:segregation and condensation protein A
MISEPSWEDVIVRIVSEEGMDPWKLDLIRLADVFAAYVGRMDQLDLRIPARFILIAAILLRLKSDILAGVPQKQALLGEPGPEKDSELIRLLAQIPPLQPPVKRMPLGPVTMEELLAALRKAFEVEERRKRKKEHLRRRVDVVLPQERDDITDRIARLLEEINKAITDIEGSTTFSKIVKKWERREIVRTLMPMLHLSQEGKITHEQPVLFEDIIVKKKKKEGDEGGK